MNYHQGSERCASLEVCNVKISEGKMFKMATLFSINGSLECIIRLRPMKQGYLGVSKSSFT